MSKDRKIIMLLKVHILEDMDNGHNGCRCGCPGEKYTENRKIRSVYEYCRKPSWEGHTSNEEEKTFAILGRGRQVQKLCGGQGQLTP